MHRRRDVNFNAPEYSCRSCEIVKPADSFLANDRGLCRPCKSVQNRKYYYKPDVHERRKRQMRARLYGLTENHIREMGDRCQICGDSPAPRKCSRLHVDHCHSTGRVRGLLCASCNGLIKIAKDSKFRLIKAIEYLERAEQAGSPDAV
jgi:hypothetical protein